MSTAAGEVVNGGASGGTPNSNAGNNGIQPNAANAAWFGELPSDRPQEFRDWVTNKGFKDPVSALESQFNLEKLIGFEKAGRTVVLPKDDKDVEGLKSFRTKMGVPESPDKYELPLVEGDTSEASKKFSSTVANWMHELGVPKSAAQALAQRHNDYFTSEIKAQQDAEQAQSAQALTELKGKWGDKFEANAEYARRFLKGSGWDDAKLAKYEATFGTASMLEDFHKWGSATGEHAFANGEGGGGSFGITMTQAQDKLNTMRTARAEGKISDMEWRNGKQAEFEKLAQFVESKKSA